MQEKQILRQGRLPVEKFPGPRVLQGKQVRVQRLPAERGQGGLASWPKLPGLGLEVRAMVAPSLVLPPMIGGRDHTAALRADGAVPTLRP